MSGASSPVPDALRSCLAPGGEDFGLPSTDPRRSPFATPLSARRRTFDLERTRSDPGYDRPMPRPLLRSSMGSYSHDVGSVTAADLEGHMRSHMQRQQRDDEQDWIQLLENQNAQLMDQISTLSRDVGDAGRESKRELVSALLEIGALREEMQALRSAMDAQTRRHTEEVAQFRTAAIKQKVMTSEAVDEARGLIDKQEQQISDLERERQELMETLKAQDVELLRLRRRVGALAEEMLQKRWLQSATGDGSRRGEDVASSDRFSRRSQGLHTPMPSVSTLIPSPAGGPNDTPATAALQDVGSPLFSEFLPVMQMSNRSRAAAVAGTSTTQTSRPQPISWAAHPDVTNDLQPRTSVNVSSPLASPSRPASSRAGTPAAATSAAYIDFLMGLGIFAIWHSMVDRGSAVRGRLSSGLEFRKQAWLKSLSTLGAWAHFFVFLLVAISVMVLEGPRSFRRPSSPTGPAAQKARTAVDTNGGGPVTNGHKSHVDCRSPPPVKMERQPRSPAFKIDEVHGFKHHHHHHHGQRVEEHKLQFARRGSMSPSLLSIRSHSSPT